MFTLRYFLVSFLIDFHSALPQHKAEILVDQGGNFEDVEGNKFAGRLGGNGRVNGQFKNGRVSAGSTHLGGNQIFKAAGPNGQIQSGSVVTGSRTGEFISSGKDRLTIDTANPSRINGVLQPSVGQQNPFTVIRPNPDQTIVTDSKGNKFVVSGITSGNGVNIDGGVKPYRANLQSKTDGNGNIQAINTKLKENTLLGVGPSYSSSILGADKNSVATIQLSANPLDTGTNFHNILPSVTLRVDKIRTLQCPEENYGDFLGSNGFRILDDSISFDIQPISVSGSSKTYGFPSCFTVRAKLQIPANVDIENVGGQLTTYISPLGYLDCDKNYECHDSNTLNRPQGSCFFCNLCAKAQRGKTSQLLGSYIKDESNICLAKGGKILPLEWQVCPPDANIQPYNLFTKDLLGVFKQDVDATIRIFEKAKAGRPAFCSNVVSAAFNPICKLDSTTSWRLASCRQAVISYSVTGQALGSGSAFGRLTI